MAAVTEPEHAVMAISQIPETYTHVMVDWARYGDGNRDPEDCMGKGQRIQIAITQKKHAGSKAPYQCYRREDRLGRCARAKIPAATEPRLCLCRLAAAPGNAAERMLAIAVAECTPRARTRNKS